MIEDTTVFNWYGNYFDSKHIKKNVVIPFKDHPQFTTLIDILIRQQQHHVMFATEFGMQHHALFLQAFLQFLTQENTPHPLQGAELIYIDIKNILRMNLAPAILEQDCQTLCNRLNNADKYLLFALTHCELLNDHEWLRASFTKLFNHPQCRFLILTPNPIPLLSENEYAFLQITGLTETDSMAILKQHRTELENFHHVLIPDELLTQAYAFAERYLSPSDALNKALLLLDSSAARANTVERNDNANVLKPVLTSTTLLAVLSAYTQIPATHLPLHKFKFSDFIYDMQQRIFHQDVAITLIGHELQQAQSYLQPHTGPFCSLLFAGPKHAGKKTTALALVQQLFKQSNFFYCAPLFASQTSPLVEIKLQNYTDKSQRNPVLKLTDVIRQTPYAVIMFENIEEASTTLLAGLHELLSTGFLYDDAGHPYDFRQALVILSTTLCTQRLAKLVPSGALYDETHEADLIQLVMSTQLPVAATNLYSPQDLVAAITPEITTKLPASLCQHARIVPFLPLNKSALEKIICMQLKSLDRMLASCYGIELVYAPEVLRFLMQYAGHVNQALKQVYFVVEQTILNQGDHKHRPNQLFLQLNETGQVLRCDWLGTTVLQPHTS